MRILFLILILPSLCLGATGAVKAKYYPSSWFTQGTPETVWRVTGALSGSSTVADSVSLTGSVTSVTDVLIPTNVDIRRQATPDISAESSEPSLMTRLDGSDLWQLTGTYAGSQSVTITYSSTSSKQTFVNNVTVTGTTRSSSQFDHYVAGSLARHITDGTGTLMSGKTLAGNGALYSTKPTSQKPMTSTTWVRSGSCWLTSATGVTARAAAADADGYRTGSIGITAISPRHVLMVNHAHLWPGHRVYFVTASGSTVMRTISAVVAPIYSEGKPYDLAVAKLDSDLPDTIDFLPVMPAGWNTTYLPGLANGIPAVQLGDRAQSCPVHNANFEGVYFGYKQLMYARRTDDWGHTVIVGDSGTPLCALVNNRLVLLHLVGSAGASISQLQTEINAAMTALGGGYQLGTVNLSAFTTF